MSFKHFQNLALLRKGRKDDEQLLQAARSASNSAYCDYSNFPVGAAVLMDDGRVFQGCNIENASYGLTICAERVAVFAAIAAGAGRVCRIAISCPRGDPAEPDTLMPCGACRQVLEEFRTPDLVVLIDRLGSFPFIELFPRPFKLTKRTPQPKKPVRSDANNAWVIFDADNTLWLYDTARQKMCQYLGSRGIDPCAAEKFQRARDRQLHDTYGYSACRFARSFEDSLLHFLPAAPPEDVGHMRRLALEVFEQRPQMADGLGEVLVQISAKYQMGIITAGERWVQERRLADFHLRDLFAAIEIVEVKNEAVFRSFAAKRGIDLARSWVVGDSYRSDIVPAKAAGFRAVLLETPNWAEVENQKGPVPPDVVIKDLKDLAEVIEVIPPRQ